MIVVSIILLLAGFTAKVTAVWALGVAAGLLGAVLNARGATGKKTGGRRYWY